VKIVGVGVGPDMLTMEAVRAIEDAEVIYGSRRAIELAAEHISCEINQIKDYSRLHELPDNAVVLSTGDPNLSGLGKYARPGDVVIPGISSLQAACARLHIDQSDIVVITAHGRDPAPAAVKLGSAITSGFTVFLLPAYEFGVEQVAAMLSGMEIDVTVAVFERLGYQDERVEVGSVRKPPCVNSGLYCIMVGYAVV
jgi:cobalt-precorrin-7 (C5)-methyltransferase